MTKRKRPQRCDLSGSARWSVGVCEVRLVRSGCEGQTARSERTQRRPLSAARRGNAVAVKVPATWRKSWKVHSTSASRPELFHTRHQLALNKLLINEALENMGLRTSQMLGTFFDGATRHTEEAYRWAESFEEQGFRVMIRERDDPWQDYGSRPRPERPPHIRLPAERR